MKSESPLDVRQQLHRQIVKCLKSASRFLPPRRIMLVSSNNNNKGNFFFRLLLS